MFLKEIALTFEFKGNELLPSSYDSQAQSERREELKTAANGDAGRAGSS